MRLRDRDTIVSKEGLIFRVFGYTHPETAYICDAEYAPEQLFKSENSKALRQGNGTFYKFYEDEAWKFIRARYPDYMILHEMLQSPVLGIKKSDIAEVRRPQDALSKVINSEEKDELQESMLRVVELLVDDAGLSAEDFGVFGSILQGFHHPKLSDIDLTIYGTENAKRLRGALREFYSRDSSPLRNEFETEETIKSKMWRFHNITPAEFIRHQRRKLIYALFKDEHTGRTIKTEFEPIKNWNEIRNEYDSRNRITHLGWTKVKARVNDDSDGLFIPSSLGIEPLDVIEGPVESIECKRVVSYLEEFRMQAWNDEIVYIAGNLERVTTAHEEFLQVTITYCPRYYEQALKSVKE